MSKFTGLVRSCWILAALPAFLLADDEAYRLLDRMSAAMSQMSYQGTFVYMRGDVVESMRITHVVDEHGSRERLVSVSGAQREVFRDSAGVRWILGDDGTVLANSESDRPFFPELPLGDAQKAAASYDFRVASQERIAGRASRRVDVLPRDDYRYGYSLWLEAQSGLLLQWKLKGNSGETLAQLTFTELKMGSEVDHQELREPPMARSATGAAFAHSGEVLAVHFTPKWEPSELPPGFRLASHRVQQAGNGSTSEHLVYSDGIAAVSVYVESADPDAELEKGLSHLGTTHAFTRTFNGMVVTTVGDVPAATVKVIGESVRTVSP